MTTKQLQKAERAYDHMNATAHTRKALASSVCSDFDEAKVKQLAARRSSEEWDAISDKLEESDPIGSAWCQFMFLVRCHVEIEAIDEVSAKEAERHSRRINQNS